MSALSKRILAHKVPQWQQEQQAELHQYRTKMTVEQANTPALFKKPEPVIRSHDEYFMDGWDMYHEETKFDWGVRGLYERNTKTMLFGDYATWKSFTLLDLAIHVALGIPWRGLAVRQGPVYLLIGEGGSGIKRRVKAWFKHRGMTPPEDFPLHISKAPINLRDGDRLVEVMDMMYKKYGKEPELIGIDTLHNSMGGLDENAAKDVAVVLDSIGALQRKFEAAIWVVHHTGQSNKGRARGSSALDGGFDNIYRTDKITDSSLQMVNTKLKDGTPYVTYDSQLFLIHLGEQDGYPVTSLSIDKLGTTPSEHLGKQWGITGSAQMILFSTLFEMGGLEKNKVGIGRWEEEAKAALKLQPADDGQERTNESVRASFSRAKKGLLKHSFVQVNERKIWLKNR